MADYDDRLGDYIDVPARIAEFRTKHPEGSLQPFNPAEPFSILEIDGRRYIVVVAAAYRTPDDPRPGVGMAYEQWPGRTPYTRDSELQNAETSAWGRAIVAVLAADTKRGVASREEVRNRTAERALPEWDPVEQEKIADEWGRKIAAASLPEDLDRIGQQILAQVKSRRISPDTFEQLKTAGAAQRDELAGFGPKLTPVPSGEAA